MHALVFAYERQSGKADLRQEEQPIGIFVFGKTIKTISIGVTIVLFTERKQT